jgi:hypothetical protein
MKLLILLLSPIFAFGLIVESQNTACLLKYADTDTLIVCDIDNTLIESALHMGSAQWRDHIRSKARKTGYSENEVETILDKFWLFAQFFIPVRCVDPNTASSLAKLQQSQAILIALTAREPIEIALTEKQLHSVGIDLSHSHFSTNPCSLPLPYPSIYDKGIVYCGENTKDAVLIAFFHKMNYFPRRVVFIDDRLEHLQRVENVLQSLGIEFIGIRFSGADARVKAFDPAVADLQWSLLPTIVSDEEALNKLN